MLPLLYGLQVFCTVSQSTLGKCFARRGGAPAVFNGSMALSGTLFFLLIGCLSGMTFHVPTLLWGILYGLSLCLSMHAGLKALATGPLALTGIIASFSLVIPLLFGVLAWGETLSAAGGAGIVLLAASILLLCGKRESGIAGKWLLFAFLTFAANGVCAVVQKYHQLCYPQQYRTEFMLFSLSTVLLVLLTVQLFRGLPPHLSASGLAAGVLNGAANFIILLLAAAAHASVLFPLLSVAKIMATFCVGALFFGERPRPLQLLGLFLGILSIVLLNI